MRFKRRKHLDKRIKTRFLLFPKTINNETRWLEKATYQQLYHNQVSIFWKNEQWLEKGEYENVDL